MDFYTRSLKVLVIKKDLSFLVVFFFFFSVSIVKLEVFSFLLASVCGLVN